MSSGVATRSKKFKIYKDDAPKNENNSSQSLASISTKLRSSHIDKQQRNPLNILTTNTNVIPDQDKSIFNKSKSNKRQFSRPLETSKKQHIDQDLLLSSSSSSIKLDLTDSSDPLSDNLFTQVEKVILNDCESQHIPESPIFDIDKADPNEPLYVHEYAREIFESCKENEIKYMPKPDYINTVQDKFAESHRSVLINWLIEVAEDFKLADETLYLTVSYLDRFLSINPINRSRLQLVGVACMLLASKFEEIRAPTVSRFVYMTDFAYTREQVIEMEALIINALEFRLITATRWQFLHRYLRATNASPEVSALSRYLSELSLLDYSLLEYYPSTIAKCTILLARQALGITELCPNLEHYSRKTYSSVYDCLSKMLGLWKRLQVEHITPSAAGHNKDEPLIATYEKYRRSHRVEDRLATTALLPKSLQPRDSKAIFN